VKRLIAILFLFPLLAFGQVDGKGTFYADTVRSEFSYTLTKHHGFYAFEDSAAAPDLTQNTWAHITNASNTLFTAVQDGQGFVIVNDTFHFNVPSQAGLHPHIIFHYGVDGHGGNNEDYEVRVYNVTGGRGVVRKAEGSTSGANNRIEIGTTAYDSGSNFGDRYVLQIVNRTNNNDFTFENGSIFMEVSHY
jgi:hypothetical protein